MSKKAQQLTLDVDTLSVERVAILHALATDDKEEVKMLLNFSLNKVVDALRLLQNVVKDHRGSIRWQELEDERDKAVMEWFVQGPPLT